jgi:Zn-dependent protease
MPIRSGSFQLARVFGIRIGVNTSWFFVLFFFIWFLSGNFHTELGGSDTTAYAIAVAGALGFFASLILHELGHAIVARRSGIEIAGIELWFFGGVARMSRDTNSAGEEFRVAVAGPLVTFAIAVVCVGAGAAIYGMSHFVDVAGFTNGVHATPGLVLLTWIATINLLVLIFNLVPAFPLDGGRIARAIAWKITGDRNRATRASGRMGQAFAYLLSGAGIFLLLGGDFSSGLWLIILGMFLGQAARGAVLQSAFSERLEGVTVADIMDREPVTIDVDATLLQAQDEYFLRYRWPWFAVTDAARHFIGVVRRERVEQEIGEGRPALRVADILDEEGAAWRISQDQPLEALLGSEGLRRLGAVVAVDAEGVLRGVVTLSEVRRALTPMTGT